MLMWASSCALLAWAALSGGGAVVWALFAVFATVAWLLIGVLQRWRSLGDALARGQDSRSGADAERLALALRGGDLALWDLHRPTGRSTVNDRWYEIVGHGVGEIPADEQGWQALVHPEDLPRVLVALQSHLRGETPSYEATYRMHHRAGHWVWVLDRGRVVERDAQGQPLRVVGTHLDISERMRVEEALRLSEQKSRALLDALHAGVVVHGADTQVLEANPAACRILGLSKDQMLGKQAMDPAWAFLEEDGTAMRPERHPVNQVIVSGQALRDQVVGVCRPDRVHPVWTLCSAFAVLDGDGRLKEVVVAFSDFTERKAAQEELRRSEARLRMASRVAHLGGWRLSLPEQQLAVSVEAAAIVDATPQEMLSLDGALRGFVPAPPALLPQRLAELARGGPPFEFEMDAVTRAGRAVCLRVLGEVVRDATGQVTALQGAVQDITESRRARQQLRLLEASVARLNDVVLITELDPALVSGPHITFVNNAFERLTGYRREEVLGRPTSLLHGPLTSTAELQRIEQALAQQCSVRAELVNYTKSGRPFWIEIEIVPLVGVRGNTTHNVAVERDISERKRAEAEIRAAQESLAATLAAVPDLLFEVDLDGRIHSQHSPRRDLLLVPAQQFLGRGLGEVLPAEATEVVLAALSEAHANGHSVGLQYELPLPQGRRWFELSVARKTVATGEVPRFVVLARDVTERQQAEGERRALERQLREAQKLESIGTLAGGIAHDFNNILSGILGNVALARDDLPSGSAARTSLDQIDKAGLRARSLVQQILTFSRRQPQPLQVQSLQPAIEESVALLRASLPATVQLEVELPSEALFAETDATQLQQVLMNLCTNAWHALPDERGQIQVGLEAMTDDAAQARDGELPRGPCVHLWVRDNGCGMDEATRERIFDPFFTTKPVGKGTGLGLSVVHGIVRGHRGAITVETAPGAGASFHVYLPQALPPPGAGVAVAGATAPATPQGDRKSVLYVDDDEVMGLMVQRLLQRAGYRVTVCSESPPALALIQAQPDRFDLVLSDYNMPEMSGLELALQLAQVRAALPVIISSGYIDDELRRCAQEAGVRALLSKEATIEDLVGTVQRVMAGAPA
jgi:PAS domain S-box-containing protein